MRPERTTLSRFELKRRSSGGDKKADGILTREGYYDDVVTVLRVKKSLLLITTALLSVLAWGWGVGVLVGVLVAFLYGALAQTRAIRWAAQRLYKSIDRQVLLYIPKISPAVRLLSGRPSEKERHQIGSKDELLHMTRQSPGILSTDEKLLLESGLKFGNRLVSEVMTPQSVIETVNKGELLGPLTLDELYKKGHSRLPVIDGDINHIIGILYIQDLLTVTSRKTPTAEEAMEQKVFYIREDQTLQHALSAFLKTHHHLFVVVNEYRETVGVLSLEDVMEAFLGKKIDDEYDEHSDLRVVAERNVKANNTPKSHIDV